MLIMATKSTISILFALLCLLNFSTLFTLSQPTLKINDIDQQLSDKLLNKGYGAMGVFGLGQYLDHLLTSAPLELTHNITAVTVFCPTDEGFIKQDRLGPATTLLHYHVVPFNVDRKILESSPVGTPFPTFLVGGPPLVKTVIPYTARSSINNVTILDWEIYNDGKVIVHGVENFFDPDFPLLHPYAVAKQDPCAECKKNLNDHHDDEIPNTSNGKSSFSMKQVFNSLVTTKVLLIAISAVLAALILGFSYYCYNKKTRNQDLPVKTSAVDALSSIL